MKTIKELSDRQIKLAWISSKSLYEICKKLEIHDNTYNRKYLRVWGVKEGLKIPVFTRFTKTDYVKNPKLCKKCKKPIPWNQRENNFCSHSCATSYTNIKRGAITSGKYVKNATSKCLNCGKEIFARNKYCSIICQVEFKYKEYIQRWKDGKETGMSGTDILQILIPLKSVSNFLIYVFIEM